MKTFLLKLYLKKVCFPELAQYEQIKTNLLAFFIEQKKNNLEKLWEENDLLAPKDEDQEEYVEEEVEVEEEIEEADPKNVDNKEIPKPKETKNENDSLKNMVNPLINIEKNKQKQIEFEFQDESLEQFPQDISNKEPENNINQDSLKSNSNIELTMSDNQYSETEKQDEINLAIQTESDVENEKKDAHQNVNELEEAQFGTIAVIAQRFNKIDTIDDWKKYIKDLIIVK